MSEYPVHCDKCGNYLGYVHATAYSNLYLCERCFEENKSEGKNG